MSDSGTPRTSTHDVTVIGLGAMGGELAKALLAAGRRVVVWNRSLDKTRALSDRGATVAASPAAAISASPVTLICLWNYDGADEVLARAGVDEALQGKVVVQLSTGTATEMTRQGGWVKERGGEFLAGGIMCYPRAIGASDTVILYSGSPSVYADHAELLSILAPAQKHVGDALGDVATVYAAVWGFYFAAVGGLLDGLALVRTAGVSADSVKHMIVPMAAKIVEGGTDVLDRLASGDFAGDQATVDGHIDGIEATCTDIRGLGLEPRMLEAFVSQLRTAAAEGRGSEDIASVVASLSVLS